MNKTGIKKTVWSFFFILLLLLFYGCIKENFNSAKFDTSLNLKSGLAIPIGFSHLSPEKFLSDTALKGILRKGQDGFLSLYYSTVIDSGVLGNMLLINNTSINKSFLNQTGFPIFLNFPGMQANLSDSVLIPVSAAQTNPRIDSITLLSGTLQLTCSAISLTGTLTYQIPGLKLNGIPFSATRNLPNAVLNIPLAGYTIVPQHDISGNNLLKCVISVNLLSPSGPVNPNTTIADIQTDLTGMNYKTIYGDFNGYTIDFPSQTISTPFFRQLSSGQISFADPKIKLFFANSVGVPFGISFSRIDAIDKFNLHILLAGSGVPALANPKIIRYPSIIQAGQTIADSLVLDKTNSNLPGFIATNPDSITIKASVTIASLPPPSSSFISFDSKYKVSAAIELPLWGKADFVLRPDTIKFNYLSSGIPPPDQVEKLILRSSITNSFPVSVYPQIYLMDGNYLLLDSLFTGIEKIEGAVDTNGDGKADPQKQAPIDILLPRSRIDNLLNTKYLVTKGRIKTTDFPTLDVKLYSTYYLDYNIGVIAQLKIKTGK